MIIRPIAIGHTLRHAAYLTPLCIIALVGTTEAQEFQVGDSPALPFPPGVSVQSQCGLVDDLQHVEFYDGTLDVARHFVDTHEASTIQLQWLNDATIRQKLPGHSPGNIADQRWCSGTLLDNEHVITAGHCFDVARGDRYWVTPFRFGGDGQPVFAEPDALARLFVVNFRYQLNGETGSIRDSNVFPVIELTEYRLGGLDFAIVRLGADAEGRLPADLDYVPAQVDAREVSAGEMLTIIQHPQGDPKKVEAGKVLAHDGPDLYYSDIDTHGGSSGAGVRDGKGHVIAVHTHGGCQRTGSGANRGVGAQAIAAESALF